jgi:hypothetical protein
LIERVAAQAFVDSLRRRLALRRLAAADAEIQTHSFVELALVRVLLEH